MSFFYCKVAGQGYGQRKSIKVCTSPLLLHRNLIFGYWKLFLDLWKFKKKLYPLCSWKIQQKYKIFHKIRSIEIIIEKTGLLLNIDHTRHESIYSTLQAICKLQKIFSTGFKKVLKIEWVGTFLKQKLVGCQT